MAVTKTVKYFAEDASWQPGNKAECFILLKPNYFTITVFDVAQFRYVWLKTVEAENYSKAEIDEALPKFQFKNIHIFSAGNKTTLVPQPLYDEQTQQNFFGINHELENNEILQADLLKRLQAYLIYAVPEKWFRQLKNDFSAAKFYHEDVAWLEVLMRHYKNQKGVFLHADFAEEHICISVIKDGKLLLYNYFPGQTPEDKLYFIMFVAEQLQVNPQQDSFLLSGNIAKTDESWALFSKYIKNMKLYTRPEPFRFALPLQNNLPEPFFTKTFCTAVCAL